MSIINSDGLNTNWQLNVLRGLQAIADEVAKPLTCAEDGITVCSPPNGLKVNVHDGTGVPITSTIVGTDKGLDVNIINALPLEVNLDAANDQVGIFGYNGTTPTAVSVDSNGFVNTNAAVTFSSSLPVTQDPLSNPWTVNANDLDIRDLTFASDKVDVSGSNINATITGPFGVQADCADAISTTLCQTQEDILTAIKDAVEGTVDVNIVSGVTLEVNLDPDNDGVTIYGSDPTVPILTDSAGHLQVDVLTLPSVTATIAGPLGSQACNTSVGVALCTTQAQNLADIKTAVQPITTITPNIISEIVSGQIAVDVYSITFFNSGSSTELISFDAGSTWVNLPAGVSISMDAGGLNNKYPANLFQYDVIGSGPVIITYNS